MRLLLACLLLSVLSVACGDGGEAVADSARRPERLRACGALEGVKPVEPVTIGTDIEGGCPVFEPVPCTQPRSYYDAYCGSECIPAVGISEDGDEWLLGCARWYPDMPCPLVDYRPVNLCGIDPFQGNTFWYTPRGCPIYFFASACWSRCDSTEAPPPTKECWSP